MGGLALSGPPAYRGLVLDFGGVLTTSIFDSFSRFCEREGVDRERLSDILRESYRREDPESLVARVETGRIGGEEFEREMAAALSVGLHRPIDPSGLVRRMLEELEADERMIRAVRRARAEGIRTALLSNSWGDHVYSGMLGDLEELFDAVAISGVTGIRKPDPEAFRLVVRLVGVPAEECVFVDDIPSNVEAAERVGMRGVHHREAGETIPRLERLLGVSLDG